jgi:hypothetical protein
MLKEMILISSYNHVIFLLGDVQQPFALGIIAVMCFDIFHIIISVFNVLWFYGVMLLCAVSQTLPNIRALHHTTVKHSRPGYYKTRHDMYVAATQTLSAHGN